MALRTRDDVVVRIGAETAGLDRGLSDTRARLRGFALGAVDAARKIALIGAAAVAAGGAILVHLVRGSMEAVDAQSKLARQIGATTRAVQTLDRAAELAGVENLSRNAQLMTQRLGEAATGTGTAKDALAALGLTVDELMALDADERFIRIAEAMDRLGMTAEQRANVLRDFGFRGTEMAGLLENGAAAIRQAQRDVEDFGVALSDVDAQAIERAGDEMSTFGTVVDGVTNQLSASLAPVIAVVSKRLTDSARGTAGFREEIDNLVDRALDGIGWLLDALQEVWGTIISGRTVVLGLKTLFLETWATVIQGAELALIEVRRLYNTIAGAVGLDLIPEIDTGRMAWIEEQRQAAVEARQAAESSAGAWRDLMAGPRPSEWIRGMREEAAALREELTGSVGTGPVGDSEGGDPTRAANDNDDLRERLAGRLEAFDDALADEEERERRSFDKRRTELLSFLEAGLIDRAGYFDRLAELEVEHDARLAEIRDAGATERLARLDEELMSQEERQDAWYQERLFMLQGFMEQGLLSQAEAVARAEAIEQHHMERLAEIRRQGLSEIEAFTRKSYGEQAQTVLGELTGITAGVARENKRLFQLNKLAGVANAIVNAYTGISKTMAAYPYPINIGMAAAHAAAAFAQVQAIRSASFGGGGGTAPSVRGSTPAAPVSNVPAAAVGTGTSGAVVNLTLNGERFGREQVRRLIEQINEAVGDGARLRIA